jgi:hypothetical protein
MEPHLVLSEIDRQFKSAGRKDRYGPALSVVPFEKPKNVDKLRERRFGFVEVEYRIDIQYLKLLRFATS